MCLVLKGYPGVKGCRRGYLSGVLVLYPGADVWVKGEVGSKVLKVLWWREGLKYKSHDTSLVEV